MDKRNLKSGTEKKIVLRGQFSTRGLNSRSLTNWTWTRMQNGGHKRTADDYGLNPTVANNSYGQWRVDV